MNNLASAYKRVGKQDHALLLHEETLSLSKTKLGPNHPHTLRSMHNLASSYRAAGRMNLALPMHKETVKLTKLNLGSDHPHTLISMESLASYNRVLKQFEKSLPLHKELVSVKEKKLGRDHAETQAAVANLGADYKDAGRVIEAIPLLEEAYRTSKTNPKFRWVGIALAECYPKVDKPVEARKLIDELLADARKQHPKESSPLAGELTQFGKIYLELRDFWEAELLLRECMAIREKREPDVWTTFNTQSMLGAALLGQKKYADAEPLLLKGYEGMKAREATIPPQGGARIPEALDRLIELYTATNKPDEVKKYRELRAKYPLPKEMALLPRAKP
jgi:eukaryotic-like serine/threonine-protein kinase